ncbi:MAG TPA: aldehyde dehydrogenase family protein [Thermoleophilaceae bacterium]|nr:aldehyde dehydrogenase family protein [Thermoleophilaceae bacterium]
MDSDRASRERFDSVDPATGEVLATLPVCDPDDVDAAVAAARSAQRDWAERDPLARTRVLLRLATLIEENGDALARLESRDVGKPYAEAASRDVPFTVQTWLYYAGWPTKLLGTTNPAKPGVFTYTLREPVGVVAAITPWNFPMTIASWKLAPALACGNAVIHKPAEEAPLSALRLAELALEAGVPEGLWSVLTGDGRTGAALAAHAGVDKLSFTGSTEVGREIQRAATGNLKRLTLELGGKSANIVLDDADLDAATGGAMNATFRNQGEVCTAGARLVAHAAVADGLVERLAQRVSGIKLGRGLDEGTEMGPLVSAHQRDRVLELYDSARTDGATVVTGGGSATVETYPDGFFVEPTIFDATRNDMRINREEIFGPAVAVIRVEDEEEAVRIANDTPFGLAAAVWTRDGGRAHRVARALRAGTVWVNMYGGLDPYSTFSGRGLSGYGYELGPESIGEYTALKTVKSAI